MRAAAFRYRAWGNAQPENQLQSVGYSEQHFRSMQRPPLHCFPGHEVIVASILAVEVVLQFHSCILELLETQMKLHAGQLCLVQCSPRHSHPSSTACAHC